MDNRLNRRQAIALVGNSAVLAAAASAATAQPVIAQKTPLVPGSQEPWPGFPRQNAELAREVVAASHGNEARVRELVTAHPALARATWDWGFGDWETALGAASHTGRRSIAEFLISQGARIDLFAAAMLGYVDVVRAFVAAAPDIQKTRGPHGIHLLAHAKAGGPEAAKVVEYLESIQGAGDPLPATPLTPEQQQVYVGIYAFGPLLEDRLSVEVGKQGLAISRASSSPRALTCISQDTFYPAGALAVTIRFKVESGRATALSILDGPDTIEARRATS